MNNISTYKEIKEIFNSSYLLYKKFNSNTIFKCIISSMTEEIDTDLMLSVLTDTATIYSKYVNISTEQEWNSLVEETHILSHQYDCGLCNKILVELLCILEKSYIGNNKKGDIK